MKSILVDTGHGLVGREPQMAQIRRAFESGARVVVLAGSFGVGKTRLAGEFARRWQQGVVIGCALGDVRDADQLDGVLSQAAGAEVAGGFDRQALLRWLQRSQGALVVLDSAEGSAAAVEELLDEAREHAPDVRWVVTSRLAWPDEREGHVTLRLSPLEPADAVALFAERLPPGSQAARQAACEAPIACEVVEKLDCLPLAIELAAARCQVLSLEQLGERLDEKRLALLQEPAHRRGEHGSVRQALMLSFEMLEPNVRASLCRLAVFRGGFTLDAADHVTGQVSSLEVIEELVAHSLLYRMAPIEGAPPRFSMLDSVRDFANEVAAPEQLAEAGGRHAQYFAQLARGVIDEPGRGDPKVFFALLAERDNFRAAFEHAVEAEDCEAAYCALRALCHMIARNQGPTNELMSLFDRAEQAGIFEGRPQLLGPLCYERGNLALDANHLELAADHFERAAPLAAQAGLEAVEIRAERGQGICHLLRADLDRAERHFLRGLEIARGGDRRLQQAFVHCGLCNLNWYRRRFDEALEHAERALAIVEREADAPIEALATTHNTLGSSLGMLGMWTRAGFHLDRAVEYYAACHNRVSELTARFNRAILAVYSGRIDEARVQLAEIIEAARGFLQDHVSTQARFNLALIELEAQNHEAVARHLEACRRLVEPDDFARGVYLHDTLDCVEVIHLAMRGEFDEARRGLRRLESGRKEASEAFVSLLELVSAITEVEARLQAPGDQSAEGDEIPHAAKYLIDGSVDSEEPPGYDWVLRRILTEKMARLGDADRGERVQPLLQVAPGARRVAWEGEVVDLSRRGPMRRMLAFLVDVHESQADPEPVDVHQLLQAGWPGEQVVFEAGLSRVYTTLRRLRDLGLREVVLTVDDGYWIDPRIRIERVEGLTSR